MKLDQCWLSCLFAFPPLRSLQFLQEAVLPHLTGAWISQDMLTPTLRLSCTSPLTLRKCARDGSCRSHCSWRPDHLCLRALPSPSVTILQDRSGPSSYRDSLRASMSRSLTSAQHAPCCPPPAAAMVCRGSPGCVAAALGGAQGYLGTGPCPIQPRFPPKGPVTWCSHLPGCCFSGNWKRGNFLTLSSFSSISLSVYLFVSCSYSVTSLLSSISIHQTSFFLSHHPLFLLCLPLFSKAWSRILSCCLILHLTACPGCRLSGLTWSSGLLLWTSHSRCSIRPVMGRKKRQLWAKKCHVWKSSFKNKPKPRSCIFQFADGETEA